eukprot:TRINITY_DN52659_c0_g1_i1.p1 TRINITY_DN52659_c0_g1~~TRINITY_DN52659_c0_g1_i1.p1  ORF type:complete len:293 (-),score=69.13 TRINITY_DN52659_c0_g1_i1:107-985(-)
MTDKASNPPKSLKEELAQAEARYDEIQAELHRATRSLGEARHAGEAVLTAVEAAMAPLMAELAAARMVVPGHLPQMPRNGEEDDPAPDGKKVTTCSELEAEIKHLRLDLDHFHNRTERLQLEEQRRTHEIIRLRNELKEVGDDLSYEQQRLRHYEVCRQLGLTDGGWVGLGPLGVGKRTLEVRAEKKLRESAEQRSGRLIREVTKLAGDTAEQQTTIEQLSRRLERVRTMLKDKDRRLVGAARSTADLHARLRGAISMGAKETARKLAQIPGARSKQARASASTGKLPQLSF